jgi:hypothetical protein
LPGIFTIAEGNYVLLNKGITLRGAGAGVTTLQRTNGARLESDVPGSNPSPIIIAGPQRYNNNDTSTALTADAVQGTNSVQVASTQGFSVGQIVLLDEASGAGSQTDAIWSNMQIWAAPDYRVVWQKHNPYYQYVDDFDASTYPYTSGSAGCWFSNCDRPTNEDQADNIDLWKHHHLRFSDHHLVPGQSSSPALLLANAARAECWHRGPEGIKRRRWQYPVQLGRLLLGAEWRGYALPQ